MKFTNLKEARSGEMEKWLIENIPEITTYQKEKIRYDCFLDDSPFYFYKKREKKKSNFLMRLSFFPFLFVGFLLLLFLPFYFLYTGSWYYNKLTWFSNWIYKLNL